VNLPNDQQRIIVLGATGSGKTVAGAWHLSQRNFTAMPWIVYDWKYDELLNDPEGIREISVSDPVPIEPGIYIVHPQPDEHDEVEAQMWDIWHKGHTGVFVDEGLMVDRGNKAFRSLLTQGRSKTIPMIILSQRPVWLDKFTFTESEFVQVFRLQSGDDVKIVQGYIGDPKRNPERNISERLPEFCSYYYDVKADSLLKLSPVPDQDAIAATFEAKLRAMPKTI